MILILYILPWITTMISGIWEAIRLTKIINGKRFLTNVDFILYIILCFSAIITWGVLIPYALEQAHALR